MTMTDDPVAHYFAPPDDLPAREVFRCPVPGCTQIFESKSRFGPHFRWHRNRGDAGVPEPTASTIRKQQRKAAKPKRGRPPGSKTKPKPLMTVTPADIIDGVLPVLYPNGIPLDQFRDVTAWVEATETLAARALAAQPPSEDLDG